jgi:hypothetical protein
MSVRARIDDAVALWNQGRKEGAILQILVAAAATAKKRYPKPTKRNPAAKGRPYKGEAATDSIGFKTFILDEMGTITGGPKYGVAIPFKGKDKVPLEDILYEHLRCPMIHEGESPSIYFTESFEEDGRSYSVMKLNDPLGFPEMWIWNLARAVVQSPENADTCGHYPINARQVAPVARPVGSRTRLTGIMPPA